MSRSARLPIARSSRLAAAAAVALLAMAAALPAQQGKESPPPPAAPKGFTLPPAHDFTLSNGMQVTFVQYGTIPKADVELVIRAGNVDEGPQQVWLADVTGDLMQEGTTSRTAQQIANAAADMGGALGVLVGANEMMVGGSVLGESTARMVALVADVVMHPAFPDSELPRLIANRERQLAIQLSQPQSLALAAFRAALYPDHPYGRVFPTAEMLRTYTATSIRSFYDANIGARRAHLYVVGRFDQRAAEQAVRGAFAAWQPGPAPSIAVPHPRSAREVHLVNRPGAVQSSLYIGLPVPDPSQPDYIALQVTNALLGGAFDSRITTNIRERKGYTYSPFSQLSARYRDAYWAEVADVTTNVTGPAMKEIFGEIDRLRREPPSAQELEGIQNYLAGTFVLRNSSSGGIINQLDFVSLHGLPADYLTGYVKRVYAVTPADVQRMAQRYLDPATMTIVVVGDQKAIEGQIQEFGKIVE